MNLAITKNFKTLPKGFRSYRFKNYGINWRYCSINASEFLDITSAINNLNNKKIKHGLADIGLMKPRSFVSKSDTTHIFTRKQFRIGSLSVEIEPGYVVKKSQSGER